MNISERILRSAALCGALCIVFALNAQQNCRFTLNKNGQEWTLSYDVVRLAVNNEVLDLNNTIDVNKTVTVWIAYGNLKTNPAGLPLGQIVFTVRKSNEGALFVTVGDDVSLQTNNLSGRIPLQHNVTFRTVKPGIGSINIEMNSTDFEVSGVCKIPIKVADAATAGRPAVSTPDKAPAPAPGPSANTSTPPKTTASDPKPAAKPDVEQKEKPASVAVAPPAQPTAPLAEDEQDQPDAGSFSDSNEQALDDADIAGNKAGDSDRPGYLMYLLVAGGFLLLGLGLLLRHQLAKPASIKPAPALRADSPEPAAEKEELPMMVIPPFSKAAEHVLEAEHPAVMNIHPAPQPEVAPPEPPPSEAPAIGISKAALPAVQKGNASSPFPQISPQTFYTLSLGVHWEESEVSEVHLHRQAALDIETFVSQQSAPEGLFDPRAESVEVAGFLLGAFTHAPGQRSYQVAVERFVPVNSGERSLYRVELSAEAWLLVDELRSRYPELALLGWFHTHPGHGLFLSQPDQNIQNQLFRHRYQIAIELDPLSPDKDLAVFTRKASGALNNTNMRKNRSWFSWNKILQWLDKHSAT